MKTRTVFKHFTSGTIEELALASTPDGFIMTEIRSQASDDEKIKVLASATGINAAVVAEHTILLLLAVLRKLPEDSGDSIASCKFTICRKSTKSNDRSSASPGSNFRNCWRHPT